MTPTAAQRRAKNRRDTGTRDRLIDAAQQCVLTRGLADTSSRAITELAAVNLASITYYFGSKENLVAVALAKELEEWLQPVLDQLREPRDPALRLLVAVELLGTTFETQRARAPALLDVFVHATRDAAGPSPRRDDLDQRARATRGGHHRTTNRRSDSELGRAGRDGRAHHGGRCGHRARRGRGAHHDEPPRHRRPVREVAPRSLNLRTVLMIDDQPTRPARWAGVGVALGFVGGGIVGLVVGLDANPSTAWFAVFEVGIPSAIVGGSLGLVGGTIATGVTAHTAATPSPTKDRSTWYCTQMARRRRHTWRGCRALRALVDGLGEQSRRPRESNVQGWPDPSARLRCARVAGALADGPCHSLALASMVPARDDPHHRRLRCRGGPVPNRRREWHRPRRDHDLIRSRCSRRRRDGLRHRSRCPRRLLQLLPAPQPAGANPCGRRHPIRDGWAYARRALRSSGNAKPALIVRSTAAV